MRFVHKMLLSSPLTEAVSDIYISEIRQKLKIYTKEIQNKYDDISGKWHYTKVIFLERLTLYMSKNRIIIILNRDSKYLKKDTDTIDRLILVKKTEVTQYRETYENEYSIHRAALVAMTKSIDKMLRIKFNYSYDRREMTIEYHGKRWNNASYLIDDFDKMYLQLIYNDCKIELSLYVFDTVNPIQNLREIMTKNNFFIQQ